MPIVEREIDVTVKGMTLNDNFRVVNGAGKACYFTFYRELTEAFCNALFDVFDEINEAGILTITYKQTYNNNPLSENSYSSVSFNIFGCNFNVLVYEMYSGTVDIVTKPQSSCPRVCIIRQFATLPEKDCGGFYKTSSASASNLGLNNYNHSKMTEYKNPLRLCFKLVINYNEDFIDISFRNTAVNTNEYNWTLPIFTAIKCQSITCRDAVYYATCCNLYLSGLNYHRLVFLDDIKNTYRGDDTTAAAQPSGTNTTSANLFLQIDSSNTHFTNLLQADNTRLELYKPICCTGFIQFSDNIMCAFDDAKVVPGEYYSINDDIYYVPGSNANPNTYRHLILKV